MITAFERFMEFVDQDRRPQLRASEFMEAVARQVNLCTPIQGTGSPEGVVTARVSQLYMDTSGAAGSVLYIKQTGVGNTGWKLV